MKIPGSLVLLLFLIGNINFALGQENFKNKIGASSMVYYLRFRLGNEHFNNLSISGPQLAYSFKNKRNNWHEFELVTINIGYTNYRHSANLALRYQYNIFILKNKLNGRLKPFAGLGALNFTKYDRSYASDNSTINFGTKYISNTLDAYVSPGVEYSFSPRIYTTLQIPLTIINLTGNSNRVYNPAWSKREQKNATSEFNLIPLESFNARLSLGYKF